MGSNFKMNPNFEREIKRQLQQKLRKVFLRYRGRPVAEVARALKREGVPEPTLSELATAISEGKEPKVE